MPPISVHVVPHTHIDPGWLDTYNGYYGRSVRGILNEVTKELELEPNRTFSWSETCYFARWFSEQSARRKAFVREAVASGRLEFVGGGWVQHDESLPTVSAILDSMAEGHAWLNETFGVRPSVGWQIDVFGHSAASAALLGRMGFSALVINRINYRLKRRWIGERHLEFDWAGEPALGGAPTLTHVLHTHYSTPKGLDFEGAPLAESAATVAARADSLRRVVLERSEAYRTQELMLLVGDDFRWRRPQASEDHPILSRDQNRPASSLGRRRSTPRGRRRCARSTLRAAGTAAAPSSLAGRRRRGTSPRAPPRRRACRRRSTQATCRATQDACPRRAPSLGALLIP